MNLREGFENFAKYAFQNKIGFEASLSKELMKIEYDPKKQNLILYFGKPFAQTLIKPKISSMKEWFYSNLGLVIKEIIINDKVSTMKEEKNTQLSTEAKVEKAISKSLSFEKQTTNNKDQDITKFLFFNSKTNETKFIDFKLINLEYKSDFLFSLFSFFTLILPLVYLSKGFKKINSFSKLKKDINLLINNDFVPLNSEAKKFCKNYLAKIKSK